MHTKEFISAVAALSLISGAAALGCKDDPVEIKSQADATQAGECKTIENDLILDPLAGKDIIIGETLKEIKGNFVVKNNGLIQSLQVSGLEKIGGMFELRNDTSLFMLDLPALEEVGSIVWVTLSSLEQATFGTAGVTKAKSVLVADTAVRTLDGLNIQNLADMDINNNRQLSKFSSSIKTLSNALHVNANAINMTMEMPNLEWIANMTIANVSSFSVPSLKAVNGSMRFDSNFFTNFLAANLTEIHDGDLSFVSNPQLHNISVPLLKRIGGGLTIANNTDLTEIDGLGSLERVGGAIIMRGSFESIALPKLKNVVGTAEFVSTEDIQDSCDKLEELSGNVIQGKVTDCEGGVATANNDTSDSGNSKGGSDSNGDDGDSAASLASASMSTVITLAALGGLVAAFL